MRKSVLLGALCAAAAWPVAAMAQGEEVRQLEAHVHGEAHLQLAQEGRSISIEMHAPGADVVGFEHEAESADELAAVAAATALLGDPLTVFGFPAAAGCSVVSAEVGVGHEEHEDEAPAAAGQPAAPAPAEEEEEHHTEFDADYELTCANIGAIDSLTFGYFASFPAAMVVDVEMITDRGPFAFEVERAQPVVDTRAMF